MKRAIDFLSPLGLLVIVGSQIVERMGKTLPGRRDAYLIAGFALILAHLLLRWEDLAGRVGRRQMRYGTNTLVLVLVVLGILGSANYLVNRHTKRWDLTKNQRYSLSEQTKKIVDGLKEDVKVTYFQRSADMDAPRDRLKQYQALSPRIRAEFVDPLKDPAKARQYDVSVVPTLVLEQGERREKISNDSEQEVTNALIKVTRKGKKTVCFSEGEGERDPEDSSDLGFSGIKSGLAASGYEVKKAVLLREGIPADCSVLVVAGPQKDLLPPLVDAVRGFVQAGGRAVVMLEPEFKEPAPNLTGLLKEWNIEAGNDLVIDADLKSQLAGAGVETPLAARYPYHEITKDFRLATAFHTARSVQAGKGTAEGRVAQNLIETSAASWAQSDLKTIHEQGPQKTDRMGPIALAAVATIRAPEPQPSPSPSPSPETAGGETKEPEKKTEGRVVAFGDADFASNTWLRFPGNKDLALNTVAWLTEDVDIISIRPKEPDDQRLFLTGMQQANVTYLALLVLPGLWVALGIATWWKRR